jgi:hypothetical protein
MAKPVLHDIKAYPARNVAASSGAGEAFLARSGERSNSPYARSRIANSR